ncbi:hypothetical protein ACIOJE_34920 [Kitasatospora sp. NPDC087861]|uniref:hypothetical protein n=1 Tax=Kitasatospora sp. NPDC087861 TaxID=3364070 RepID=UPI00382F06E6
MNANTNHPEDAAGMRADLEYVSDESLTTMLREALRQRGETTRDLRLQVMRERPEVVADLAQDHVDDIAALAEGLNWDSTGLLVERPVFRDRWALAVLTGRGEALAG